MNILSIISFIIAAVVLYFGLYLSSPKMHLYLDYPSMFIVVGGSIAATAISFHLNKMFNLLKIFFRRFLKGKKVEYRKTVQELIIAIDQQKNGKPVTEIIKNCKDEFFLEGLQLLQDELLKPDEIIDILAERNDNLAESYMHETSKMKSVSKFPPAFGMIGTTIGMIVLLDGLGAKDAMKTIGPAMGVCLITTLYGAVLANLVLIPISENLNESTQELHLKNRIVIEAVRLFINNANPVLAAEKLNSFLIPSERLDWRAVLGK